MKEENKFQKNKYELWEVIKVVNSPSGVLKNRTGFITNMYQFPWNGIWQYSILFDGFDTVQEKLEEQIESTGKFLPQEEINERLKIISRRPKFDFNEIVEIINNDEDQYIGAKGHISGMSQNYNTGEWGYGISLFEPINDNYYTSDYEEKDLISTGEFKPKEEGMSNMSLKVSTSGEVTDVKIDNPQSWEDKMIAKKWENKN